MFSDEVASRMTRQEALVGADSKSSAKFFEQAARMSLCALKTVPEPRGKMMTMMFLISVSQSGDR